MNPPATRWGKKTKTKQKLQGSGNSSAQSIPKFPHLTQSMTENLFNSLWESDHHYFFDFFVYYSSFLSLCSSIVISRTTPGISLPQGFHQYCLHFWKFFLQVLKSFTLLPSSGISLNQSVCPWESICESLFPPMGFCSDSVGKKNLPAMQETH